MAAVTLMTLRGKCYSSAALLGPLSEGDRLCKPPTHSAHFQPPDRTSPQATRLGAPGLAPRGLHPSRGPGCLPASVLPRLTAFPQAWP